MYQIRFCVLVSGNYMFLFPFLFDLGLDFGPGLGLGLVNCKVNSEVPKGVQRDRMLCV